MALFLKLLISMSGLIALSTSSLLNASSNPGNSTQMATTEVFRTEMNLINRYHKIALIALIIVAACCIAIIIFFYTYNCYKSVPQPLEGSNLQVPASNNAPTLLKFGKSKSKSKTINKTANSLMTKESELLKDGVEFYQRIIKSQQVVKSFSQYYDMNKDEYDAYMRARGSRLY